MIQRAIADSGASSSGRKSGLRRRKATGAPVGTAENSRDHRDHASVARFAGLINILDVTPGLRPGLHAAAICDGSLS
jgi:hypothetical protein